MSYRGYLSVKPYVEAEEYVVTMLDSASNISFSKIIKIIVVKVLTLGRRRHNIAEEYLLILIWDSIFLNYRMKIVNIILSRR